MEIKAEFKIRDLAECGYNAYRDDLIKVNKINFPNKRFSIPYFSELNNVLQHAWEEATRAILMNMISTLMDMTKITDDPQCQTSPLSNGSVKNTPVSDTPPPKGLPEKEKPYKDLDGE